MDGLKYIERIFYMLTLFISAADTAILNSDVSSARSAEYGSNSVKKSPTHIPGTNIMIQT